MSQGMVLTQTRIREGVWEGLLTGHNGVEPPALTAHHADRVLDDILLRPVTDEAGTWTVQLKIPVECLNEGIQSFVIADRNGGEDLTHFTIVAGAPVEAEVAAEVALLRAELDMLKRAFRRHCAEEG